MKDIVRIEMIDHGRGRVWINDQELPVTRLEFTAEAGTDVPNRLTLTLAPQVVEISGPIEVSTNFVMNGSSQ